MTTKCTNWPQNVPTGCENTNILNFKSSQNLPKLGFFWNATIPSGNPASNYLNSI
jgi:hypothetical protein